VSDSGCARVDQVSRRQALSACAQSQLQALSAQRRTNYQGGQGVPDGSDTGGFRAQQRFNDAPEAPAPPSAPEASANGRHSPPPPEWTANTPPLGFPKPTVFPPPAPPPSSRDLSTSALLRQVQPPPSEGWRKWLYLASFKLINVGESPRVTHHNNLLRQVNQPMQGCYRIALLSLKGGVGKTTITATLGATFASIRGDRVVAVDANPDRGTLSQKVPMETAATVRHLLRDAEGIERYSDVRSYTSQGPSRLEVLASESDPAVSEAFSSDDYTKTLDILERFYSLVLTDCGTGLMHSAMAAVLSKADVLIVISSGAVDGARSASATLDWLDAHGHQDLVRNSVAVINAVRPRSGKVDMNKVVDHFSRRCRAVRLVPFDPHLEEGAEISLERLKRETREALIELAAVVADGFPGADRRNAFL
jgi:MinD-like ATPase involved in chromosome partitioning or flagellar assembly